MKQHKRMLAVLSSAVMMLCSVPAVPAGAAEIAHDPNRNVQEEGVGNPFGFGERILPEGATVEELRAANHALTVQQVKYMLYKEIDEHWDLITVRFGQREREKVYALFLGIGTLESTIGGNGNGADWETAYEQGFGVSSAHAYGTLQTAVTAFRDPGSSFMQEADVPELEWYDLTKENFYDGIISNHMGLRKIIHFIRSAIEEYNLSGWQVVRGALKGHNTGWAYLIDDEGYYKNYPDEGAALAQWYYENGHLYDNVFTWTGAEAAQEQRAGHPWTDWWYDQEPSLAEITPAETTQPQETTTVPADQNLIGDVDLSGRVELADAVLLVQALTAQTALTEAQGAQADMNSDRKINGADLTLLKRLLLNG